MIARAHVLNRYGRFRDGFRGDGYFISFKSGAGFILFAVRLRWHWYKHQDEFKSRWYVGPFEVEIS